MKHFRLLFSLVALWMAGSVCYADNFTAESPDGKIVEYTTSGNNVAYVAASSATNQAIEGVLTIPDVVEYNGREYTVTQIGKEAFKNNRKLTSVSIGNNVTNINESAFYCCSNLASVSFGTGLLRIDKNAFYACTALKSVAFPDGFTSFGQSAFQGSGLECDLVFPASLYSIEASAFQGTKIKSVRLQSNPTSIGYDVFTNCNDIQAYYFPPCVLQPRINTNYLWITKNTKVYVSQATLSMLENGWFAAGNSFQTNYNNNPSTFEAYASDEGTIFMSEVNATDGEGTSVGSLALCFTVTSTDANNATAALYCPPATTGYAADDILKSGSNAVIKNALTADGKLMIPETVTDRAGNQYTVTVIGAGVFSDYTSGYCNHITNLKIPSTVTHIGVKAFRYLSDLSGNIIIPATVCQIGHPDVASAEVFYSDYYGTHKVDGVYMMHTSASQIDWYETKANNYFAYSGNNETDTYLYVCQEIYDKAYGKNGATRYPTTSAFRSWLNSKYWNGGSHVALFDPATLGLKWNTTQTIVDISGEYEVPELLNPFSLPVTYSSSKPSVAAINEDGEITLGTAEGSTTLTVTFAGNDEYPVTTPISVQTVIIRRGEPMLAEDQENHNEWNTCQALTKVTSWSPNAALYIENNMWEMPHMMDGKFYVSAYWQSNNFYDWCEWFNDASCSYGNFLQLTCSPAYLSPNYGWYYIDDNAGSGSSNHDEQYGSTLGGFICFKVKGSGTIIVRGFTVSNNAKMGICVQGNTPLLFSGGDEDTEITYNYTLENANDEAYAYVYGVSLSPGSRQGYIKYIKFIPDGTVVTDVSVGGVAVEEESDDVLGDGGSIGFEWREYEEENEEEENPDGARKSIKGGDAEGGEGETPVQPSKRYYPVLKLNGATLTSTDGPAIEVNSHDRFVIELSGSNTITTTNGDAAISMGTLQSAAYWGGGTISIVGLGEGASLTIDGIENGIENGIYLAESSINMENVSCDISGTSYGVRFQGWNPQDYENDANCNMTFGKGMSLKMRGGEEALSGFNAQSMNNMGYYDEEAGKWMQYDLLESDPEDAQLFGSAYGIQEWVEVPNPDDPEGGSQSYMRFTPAKYLYFGLPPTEVPVTVSSYGMATFCSKYGLNFTGINNVKAYVVSEYDDEDNTLTLTRVYEVPAETGLVLYSTNGGEATATVPVEDIYDYDYLLFDNQLLIGCTRDEYITPVEEYYGGYVYTNFVLSVKDGVVGFYRFTVDDSGKRKVEKGKAYLSLEGYRVPTGGTRGFTIAFNDISDMNGIADYTRETTADGRYYNLNGQQINAPQKGLYIKSGKKIVVK